MPRRKERGIPNELLDQLLAGDAGAASDQGGLLDSLKKALTERALTGETDHHLAGEDGTGNTPNGYGRKTVMTTPVRWRSMCRTIDSRTLIRS